MTKNIILDYIRSKAREVLPKGASLLLFGSQARGDSNADSDWDLLILLPESANSPQNHDTFLYPFFELGWKLNIAIEPILYTLNEWNHRSSTPLYRNVQTDGILLWH